MNCDTEHECPAKSRPDTPCWEIAGELNDYRAAMDICQDCIVYMLKAENSVLSEQEIQSIMNHKTNCALAA
ncbi:MAG: hypothetical protein JRF02_09440 [Deltaproteobacteria bacterium]|nr:hypothetical protein [Deltaproteobacteria bacterium]